MITAVIILGIVLILFWAWKTMGDDLRDAIGGAAGELCEHSYGGWSTTTQPTCTEEGIQTRTCRINSEHTETRSVDARGHNWNEGVLKTGATCTSPAVYKFTCQRSGCTNKTKDEAVGTELGHDFEEGECTLCGEVSQELQPPNETSVFDWLSAKLPKVSTVQHLCILPISDTDSFFR